MLTFTFKKHTIMAELLKEASYETEKANVYW